MIKYGKWVTTQSEEYVTPVDYHETREEALVEGLSEYEGDSFYVCKTEQPYLSLPSYASESFIEGIKDFNEDQCGEFSDAWFERKIDGEYIEAELKSLLSRIVENYPPNWFMVGKVELINPGEFKNKPTNTFKGE